MVMIAAANLIAGLQGDRLPHCVNPQVYERADLNQRWHLDIDSSRLTVNSSASPSVNIQSGKSGKCLDVWLFQFKMNPML